MAISSAELWYSGMVFAATPETKNSSSSRVSAAPSRFRTMMSTMRMSRGKV
jgi:hypothetical protein